MVRQRQVENGRVRLNVHHAGVGPPCLFLHGFPDSIAIWQHQLRILSQEAQVIVPDLRGYGRSGRPEKTAAYHIDHLVGDVVAILDTFQLSSAVVVGHDWGGIIAWAVAAAHPERVRHLVAVNAPHPALLARRIADTPAQAVASAYIDRLVHPDAERHLLETGLDHFWNSVFGELVEQDFCIAPSRAESLARWREPGALTAMLNYYRGNPLAALSKVGAVAVPTSVVWGLEDKALLPCLLEQIDEVAPDSRVLRQSRCGHWLPYQKPEFLHELLRQICGQNAS